MLDVEKHRKRLDAAADTAEAIIRDTRSGDMDIDVADVQVKAAHTLVQGVKASIMLEDHAAKAEAQRQRTQRIAAANTPSLAPPSQAA